MSSPARVILTPSPTSDRRRSRFRRFRWSSGAADRFGFTPAELALCCASHNAEARHQDQVAAMLAKLGLDQTALQCGAPLPSDPEEQGRVLAGLKERSPLQCDCSGKHTGMLATSLHLGYPIDNYLDPDHPSTADQEHHRRSMSGAG